MSRILKCKTMYHWNVFFFLLWLNFWIEGGGCGGGCDGGGSTIAHLVYQPTYYGGYSLIQITLFLIQTERYINWGNWFKLSEIYRSSHRGSRTKQKDPKPNYIGKRIFDWSYFLFWINDATTYTRHRCARARSQTDEIDDEINKAHGFI